jgi:hypothetical protein
MTVSFRKAQRSNLGLLLSIAGGTGAGKTYSSLALAKGIAGGERFAICDTERGRASFYADDFDFDLFELDPPFSPDRYLEVIRAAEEANYPVLVIDSMSHEWEGEGGLIDWHDQLMAGQESKNLSAWIKPKMSHRKMVNHLVQAKPHVILCFRAAERVEVGKDDKGRTTIIPKRTLTGLDGWVPITEKSLPFEATASFLLVASAPGVPLAIKLPDPLRRIVPLDKPLSEETGVALAKWAAGEPEEATSNGHKRSSAPKLTSELLDLADRMGKRDEIAQSINTHRAKDPARHAEWLEHQLERARKVVAA